MPGDTWPGQGLTPQGGTIVGATTGGGLVVTSSKLGLLTSCSSTQTLAWNGSAWACAAGGGITNGAGNNVVPKSNGTNLVASTISDSGALVTVSNPLTSTGFVTGTRSVLSTSAGVTPMVDFKQSGQTEWQIYQTGSTNLLEFWNSNLGADAASFDNGGNFTVNKQLTATQLFTASAGITSTSAINTIGSVKGGATTDTTSFSFTNNYALPANTSMLIFNSTLADVHLTGMTPGVAGQWMLVANHSTTANLIVTDSDTNSLAANRFKFGTTIAAGGGATLTLTQGNAAFVYFDGSNWWWTAMWNAVAPANIVALQDITTIANLTGATVATTGHLKGTSSAVSLTNASCTSSTCTDVAGTITPSATSGVIVTFAGTYTGADDAGCILQEINGAVSPTFTTSATALTATTIVSGVKYHYICVGH